LKESNKRLLEETEKLIAKELLLLEETEKLIAEELAKINNSVGTISNNNDVKSQEGF